MRDLRALPTLAVVGLLAATAWGCASGGGRPQTTAPAPADSAPASPVEPVAPAAPPAPAPEPAPAAEPSGAYGPKTVVIDDPKVEETTAPTLAEAARKAREDRAKEGSEPIAVINDENLPEFATGDLSIAAEESKPPPAEAAAESGEAAAETETKGEEYWRGRVRGARIRWRDLVAEIERLEGEVAFLRRRFYDEDDGFYRDSQIKPAWDRALDRLAETRDEVERARENLETVLAEGRLAGALPGWLREGIEYEPAPEEPEEGPGIHEATEPQIIDEDDGGARP